MPPAAKRHCSVILFDLSVKSLNKAKQTLVKICANKFLTDSKDLTKLILLHSDITENCLAPRHDGFQHIHEVIKDPMPYNPTILLQHVEASGSGEANWLEGLRVAAKNLADDYECIGGIVTFQLLFITDLSAPLLNHDNSTFNKIVADLNKVNAYLYIVGPDIEIPFSIKNESHLRSWMQNLTVDSNNVNLTIVKDIITQTAFSVVCSYKVGVHLFFSYKNWGGTQPWKVPLGIGSKIQIPAQTMKILNEVSSIKLGSTKRFFKEYIWLDAEDNSVEIPNEDVISGILRHGKFVQISDNKMFQVDNPRSFSTLCFTDSSNVPEYLMQGGGCYAVLPESKQNDAIFALIECLAQKNKYIIARRVYNNNYIPRIVVLVPKPDYNPKCFVLTTLPYSEDVRINYKEKDVEKMEKAEVNNAIYRFLDNLDVDNPTSLKKVPLGINLMLDLNLQKIINNSVDKILEGRYMHLEELDIDYSSEVVTGTAIENLKANWPERNRDKIKKNEDSADDNSYVDFEW